MAVTLPYFISEGDTSNADKIQANFEYLRSVIIDSIYPVGSIYMSVLNVSPASKLGGTWVAWGMGRTPVGVDGTQTEFDTVEKTGGAKTHTLQTTEMPSHSHRAMMWGENSGNYFGVNGGSTGMWQFGYSSTGCDANFYTNRVGGGLAHNNLQPYITCFMWKRVS